MTDWPKIIADLEATGLTLYKIGVICGLQVIQIERIKAGSEPKHSAGEILISAHKAIVRPCVISVQSL